MRLILTLAFVPAFAACQAEKPTNPDSGGAAAVESGKPSEKQQVAGRLDRSRAGTPAPDAAFQDPSGDPVSLADFKGKPLLVNLWATWCAPCVAEMPTLDALAERDPGIQVLAVSQDMNGENKVDAFFAERQFETLEPYIDPELTLMTQLNVDTLPTTILYDAQGREVWRMSGMEDWQGRRAARLIAEASKG